MTIRTTFLLIFLACTGLNLTALYFQYAMDMHPCPLCITQRVFIFAVSLFALLAAIHNPAKLGRRIYCSLGIIAALIGGGVSLRHVWIQSLPEDQVPACGPGQQRKQADNKSGRFTGLKKPLNYAPLTTLPVSVLPLPCCDHQGVATIKD